MRNEFNLNEADNEIREFLSNNLDFLKDNQKKSYRFFAPIILLGILADIAIIISTYYIVNFFFQESDMIGLYIIISFFVASMITFPVTFGIINSIMSFCDDAFMLALSRGDKSKSPSLLYYDYKFPNFISILKIFFLRITTLSPLVFSQTYFIYADNLNIGLYESMQKSKNLMKGMWLKMFILFLKNVSNTAGTQYSYDIYQSRWYTTLLKVKYYEYLKATIN